MKCSCDDGVIKMGRNQFDTGFVYDKCPACNGTGEIANEPVEVCEWVNTMGFNESGCGKGNQIDLIDYYDFKYCPYCGKEIKIKE